MELRALLRPAAQLLATAARRPPAAPTALLQQQQQQPAALLRRGHKTAARTKRALKLAPHDSFLPDRGAAAFPADDSIIHNPPASEASPAHTPFLFLPRSDPRRAGLLELRSAASSDASSSSSSAILPPALRYPRREARYHLTEDAMAEMRRLRAEDPIKWSAGQLAKRFDCSDVFVRMVAPAPPSHLAWLKAKLARKMARWGPKKMQAWEDRKLRAEMLYRGEL